MAVTTVAQAHRGGQVFEKNCTMCHDTARFTGEGHRGVGRHPEAMKAMAVDAPSLVQRARRQRQR